MDYACICEHQTIIRLLVDLEGGFGATWADCQEDSYTQELRKEFDSTVCDKHTMVVCFVTEPLGSRVLQPVLLILDSVPQEEIR